MRRLVVLVCAVFVGYAAAMGAHDDACSPSPCGPNTDCTVNAQGTAICRCKPGYFPKPDSITGCGPQCTSDSECKSNEVCGGTKCVNPCSTSICGVDAVCEVRNHRVLCRCPDGYSGDPFTRCSRQSNSIGRVVTSGSSSSSSSSNSNRYTDDGYQSTSISSVNHGGSSSSVSQYSGRDDFCASFSCGSNADCSTRGRRPVCTCRSGYQGDPYSGCRRAECTENDDCSSDKVCHNYKCIDPCSTSCGINADCNVRNHVTVCKCPSGYSGDPFVECRRSTAVSQRQANDYCSPSPCGPNAKCRVDNGRAICSCLEDYIGDPIQGCRKECETDADCSLDKACVKGRCQDPCLSCGDYAECRSQNHRAICSCPQNYLGDPYTRCRPECTQHDDCPSNRACYNFKCADPCEDACGIGASCRVEGHKAVCSCPKGHTGHPFDRCRPIEPSDLCIPNPCGVDAVCKPGKDRNNEDRPVCSCRVGYIGDPLTTCRRGQCTDHVDCPDNKACYGYECKDPCTNDSGASVCGENARCDARNHGAICSCKPGYKGDPLTECRLSASNRL